MNKNDIIQLKITDLSSDGLGIGRTLSGLTCFVKDTVPGDMVEATVIKVKKNYCIARLSKVLEASDNRVEPKCPVAKQCGGCQMQQLDYASQVELKTNIVKNNLVRIGGFDEGYIASIMEPTIACDDPYRYRNKASVPVGTDKYGNVIMGFYGYRSHRIVECPDCLIGQPENRLILNCVKEYMDKYHIPAYNEIDHTGLIRHILIRKAVGTGQIMVCLVINGNNIPQEKNLISSLSELTFDSDAKVTSIVININTKTDNVILGNSSRAIYGPDYITDIINVDPVGPVKFNISANSFYQVNHSQMEKLYAKALQYAGLSGTETVWDLYCGIGTISLCLAKMAGFVRGIEYVPQAIDNAKSNAKLNDLNNTEFYVGAVESVLEPIIDKLNTSGATNPDPPVIVVDPPRAGLEGSAIDTILGMKPSKIVYVSCDSATLARDLKALCATDYNLERVVAVDQFCHSMHVETVCLLSNRKAHSSIKLSLDMDEYYGIVDKEASNGK